MNSLIGINEFVKRQTPESKFSHFDGTWEELADLTHQYYTLEVLSCVREGYRKGVVLVRVAIEKFYSSVVELKEGDTFTSIYAPRRVGEKPYIQSLYYGNKSKAAMVEVVLYSHEVLLENNSNSTDKPWEVVSINAFPDGTESPMPPETEARNILCLEGGTNPKLEDKTKEELVEYIRNMAKSIIYWNSHVCVTPSLPAVLTLPAVSTTPQCHAEIILIP